MKKKIIKRRRRRGKSKGTPSKLYFHEGTQEAKVGVSEGWAHLVFMGFFLFPSITILLPFLRPDKFLYGPESESVIIPVFFLVPLFAVMLALIQFITFRNDRIYKKKVKSLKERSPVVFSRKYDTPDEDKYQFMMYTEGFSIDFIKGKYNIEKFYYFENIKKFIADEPDKRDRHYTDCWFYLNGVKMFKKYLLPSDVVDRLKNELGDRFKDFRDLH